MVARVGDRRLRLWYQSFGVPAELGDYPRALRRHLADVAGPDILVEVGGIEESVMAAKYVRLVQTADSVAVVRAALQAEADGYDGIVIGNIFDPGLYEARQLLGVPVVGLGEAAFLVGRLLAGRQAVLCSNALAVPRVRENAARYGLVLDSLAFYTLGTDIPSMAAAFTDARARRGLIARVAEISSRAREDGCELLVIGSGILNTLLRSEARPLHLPVLDVAAVALHLAVALVRLHELAGVGPSPLGMFARPPADILTQVAAAYALPDRARQRRRESERRGTR